MIGIIIEVNDDHYGRPLSGEKIDVVLNKM